MKNAFDNMGGSDAAGREEGASEGKGASIKLTAREDFARRCLNAAVNLYGIVTMDEFVSLYNGYAKNHAEPVSDPMTVSELNGLVDRLPALLTPEDALVVDINDEPDIWFTTWQTRGSKQRLIVYYDLENSSYLDDYPEVERILGIDDAIMTMLASFRRFELAVLPECIFLKYGAPLSAEDTKASRAFMKFIRREYRLEKDKAEFDTFVIQASMRINGAPITTALEYIRDICGWGPTNHAAFGRLVDAVASLLDGTRTWETRGRTRAEMRQLGLDLGDKPEKLYDIFGIEGHGALDGEVDEWDDDVWDDVRMADGDDLIRPEDIPFSGYNGPIDFTFVKDAAKREAKVSRYDDVRQIMVDFVRRRVMRELTPSALKKAAVRLGFLKENERLTSLGTTLDCVVGDFASMMDDQGGGPAIRRVLAQKDKLDEFDVRAASYYANYRYTWLEVRAVKTGVGMKCRDLLTGEDLFLMERSLSLGDVKGMTVCTGVAPMEDVYVALGVAAPARFENPATILRVVLTHLGLPTECPVRLGVEDQARFAAETIRRIHSNGNFDSVVLG